MIVFGRTIKKLLDHHVEFVVIGGVALFIRNSAYLTLDLDICYERTRRNCERLVAALGDIRPRPRGFSAELPYIFDAQSLLSGTVHTFETTDGSLDLLAEVSGIGDYQQVMQYASESESFGLTFKVLSIDGLILAKKAAGRPKDLAHLEELMALKELEEKTG